MINKFFSAAFVGTLMLLLAACGRPPGDENADPTAVIAHGDLEVAAGHWTKARFKMTQRQQAQLELVLEKGPAVDFYLVSEANFPAWEKALTAGKRDLGLQGEDTLGVEGLSGSHMSPWQVLSMGEYLLIVDASGFGSSPSVEGTGAVSTIEYKVRVK